MRKKLRNKAGASTALGHDPLAWIDAAESDSEVAEAVKNEVEPDASCEVVNAVAGTIEEVGEAALEMTEEVVEEAVSEIEEQKDIEPVSDDMALEAGQENIQRIVLESHLGIAQVDALHHELLSVAHAEEVMIDVEALQQVDAAGVQLLYAFVQSSRKKGVNITWQSNSEALEKTAVQLGLKAHLGL